MAKTFIFDLKNTTVTAGSASLSTVSICIKILGGKAGAGGGRGKRGERF